MTDIIVPSPGESISEVEIGSWLVESGSMVEKDQEIALLESEKASLVVNAPESGVIEILLSPGSRVSVGSVIARIDPASAKGKTAEPPKEKSSKVPPVPPKDDKGLKEIVISEPSVTTDKASVKMTPLAREIMQEHNLSVEDILKGIRRITKEDVLMAVNALKDVPVGSAAPPAEDPGARTSERNRISLLRQKLGERLVAVKNETAMLTTFNEIDMSAVMDLRNRYKKTFEEKHQVKLGFMSFFSMAASRALKAFPQVNSQLDGEEIITFDYVDIGIAVQTPKGLMVPVLRNVHRLDLAGIESGIAALAAKARDNRITMEDLQGGTFSISNGGVFGSLLSTPILNPPQPAILGMHNIVDRPVAFQGNVVIRPMMYVALSYDHRLIDGKDSVGFLKAIKEMIENPLKMLDPKGDAERSLLDV